MLYTYLDFETGLKTFDISTLTKRGVRSIQITVYETTAFEGGLSLGNGEHYIQFPILNGRLPNNFTLKSGRCNISITELAGEGDENYWKITKENDNGTPTYHGEYDVELLK